MPIQIEASDSTRKSIDLVVLATPTGIAISGDIRWFDDVYRIPVSGVTIPCVYTDDAAYRVALCSSPPRLVLVEDDATVSDEVCSPIRWRFTSATDTCASVDVHVVRRVLVPMPSTFADVDGVLVETPAPPLPTPTPYAVSTTPVLPASTPERTEARKVRRQIRTLREECRTMKAAGLTFANMSAGQKARVNELVALLADVPLAVPA